MSRLRGYSPTVAELTPTMRAVVASAAAGRTVRATALELHVSEATVHGIRAATCARLGVPNMYAAVWAVARGKAA